MASVSRPSVGSGGSPGCLTVGARSPSLRAGRIHPTPRRRRGSSTFSSGRRTDPTRISTSSSVEEQSSRNLSIPMTYAKRPTETGSQRPRWTLTDGRGAPSLRHPQPARTRASRGWLMGKAGRKPAPNVSLQTDVTRATHSKNLVIGGKGPLTRAGNSRTESRIRSARRDSQNSVSWF